MQLHTTVHNEALESLINTNYETQELHQWLVTHELEMRYVKTFIKQQLRVASRNTGSINPAAYALTLTTASLLREYKEYWGYWMGCDEQEIADGIATICWVDLAALLVDEVLSNEEL